MRRTFALLALATAITTTAQAQKAWQTEVGLQGGFTRAVAAGTGSGPTDVISLPGFNLGPILPFATGLYAVIPWSNKVAVNTDVAFSQLTGLGSATLFQLGLRGDYALTNKVYAGAGGTFGYASNGGVSAKQVGLQAGAGYRLHLSNSLNARVEGRATFWAKTSDLPATDTYSLLFGVGTSTHRAAPAARRGAARPGREWSPQFGVSAGYLNIHSIGGADVTVIAFPGFGGALGALATPELTGPPTMFAILPIGNRIAIEPGVDMHRAQSGGFTQFLGNFSARLDFAVHGGWYAAAGGNLNYVKVTGTNAASRTGANLGWGYRFPFWGPLSGRVEVNYTMFGKNTDLGTPATNVFGLMFGTTMALR